MEDKNTIAITAAIRVKIVINPTFLFFLLFIFPESGSCSILFKTVFNEIFVSSLGLAFDKIDQNQVLSSWTDALNSERLNEDISSRISVPQMGCYTDKKTVKLDNQELALENIFAIGGKRGWYYANWLWNIRGLLDKMVGGTGIRRGRKNDTEISAGEALDFWRVLVADKNKKRLLLYAEMKLPGEAWLEFRINANNELIQTATFRPLGLWGRLYWYSLLPFHIFIFKGMAKNIATKK